MILDLFIILISISLILIFFGYYMEMSELSVVGFVFLFLLSTFVLMPRNLEYKVGEIKNITTNGNMTYEITQYSYNKYDDNTTHYFSYFLSIISILGMIFIIINIRR